MNKKTGTFIISILIPLAIGQISALLTQNSMSTFNSLQKPGFSPPAIIFPIVWTILYILMGISSYIVYNSDSDKKKSALVWYAIQLFFNFTWPLIFFGMGNYLLALIWLIILIVCICVMIVKFYQICPLAAYLQIPYLLWCLFAAYLNFSIYMLNQ